MHKPGNRDLHLLKDLFIFLSSLMHSIKHAADQMKSVTSFALVRYY